MDGAAAQAIEMQLAKEAITGAAQVGFKRLTPDAVIPTKAHASDSGFDLVASEDVIVEPGATVVVPTGIAVQLPPGYEATVRPRSGVTAKTKLRVQLGTIDNGFTGGIGVIVDNIYPESYLEDTRYSPTKISGEKWDVFKDGPYDYCAGNTYIIRKGDQIAQLVITRLPDVEAVEVFDVEESERGENGFGSSGVNTYEDDYGNSQCRNCGSKVEGGYCNCFNTKGVD